MRKIINTQKQKNKRLNYKLNMKNQNKTFSVKQAIKILETVLPSKIAKFVE
jgi:hypothetical protein